jgi:hypothetical protein
LIDPYLKNIGNDYNFDINLFDFLEKNKENNKMYFIGDSRGEKINTVGVEELLQANNLSIEVYNLCFRNDFPRYRLIELSQILESNPRMIVYFVSLSSFIWGINDKSDNYLETRSALASDKIRMDPYARSLFSKRELDILEMDLPHLIVYKKGYLIPSIVLKLSDLGLINSSTGFSKPRTFIIHKTPINDKTATKDVLVNEYKRSQSGAYEFDNKDTDQTKAFNYIMQRLKERNISVVIIGLPVINLSISKSSKDTFLNLINKTGNPYYDLSSLCSDREFMDHMHLNSAGISKLDKKLGEILLGVVRNASQQH